MMKQVISLLIIIAIVFVSQVYLISFPSTNHVVFKVERSFKWKFLHRYDELIAALIHVESSGNELAYNASTDAVGCLQICPIMVQEVNNILQRQNIEHRYDLQDRWNCIASREMFEIWASYHHDGNSYEHISRNWNGGPRGYIKTATEIYWQRVKTYLESNN